MEPLFCSHSPYAKTQQMIFAAAPSAAPVLLLGESGTGKEVAARFLHQQSPRRPNPFVPVNCGSLPSALAESLLCGSVRGSFTGADRDQIGWVRAADGGTLFLDEIGELGLEAQSRLLRILQERAVMPVGGCREIPVNFRLVCATHRKLELQVKQGTFRADLYYRIAAFPVRLPSLRERKMDIALLAQHLWHDLAEGPLDSANNENLDSRSMKLLERFEWPGNIRQLRNVLQRYRLLAPLGTTLQELIDEEQSQLWVHTPTPIRQRARNPGLEAVHNALTHHGGNKTLAARQLGISRGCLCYQVKKAYQPSQSPM